MPINILMPALSPTMEKGNLAKWHVKEGDKVASGDVIAEIETDKATMEVEAVDEGTIAKIVVQEGASDVPVNDVIAVLAGEGEDASAAAAASPAPVVQAGGRASDEEGAKAKAQAVQTKASSSSSTSGRPAPQSGGGGGERGGGAPTSPAAAGAPSPQKGGTQPTSTSGANGQSRIFASPLARRLARENQLDLAVLSGSGPHGRIVQRDIEAALKSGTGKAATRPAETPRAAPQPQTAPPMGMADEVVRKLFAEGSYDVVPHDSMRKTIARRLTEAKSTIPHFYLSADCRIDRLLALRTEINDAAPKRKTEAGETPAYKLSVNDMVIKALAMALMAVPDANVTWTSDALLKHKRADVGVAVSIPGGLITPVIRNADTKSLSAISNEMKALAKRARERKLKPEEYQGGTTAVSNLGMYGVKDFAAVINPPQATILAVGAGEERAVVERGQIRVASMMTVTLSTDHRAVDGALGAELLSAFRRYIEAPAGMLA
jgi:pyruvate dehydrogenase E2 component (dihydrolipoamide acetyltransferase)